MILTTQALIRTVSTIINIITHQSLVDTNSIEATKHDKKFHVHSAKPSKLQEDKQNGARFYLNMLQVFWWQVALLSSLWSQQSILLSHLRETSMHCSKMVHWNSV